MLVTPSGPNTSSRFGDVSQCWVSLTSWWAITVGMVAAFVVVWLRVPDYLTDKAVYPAPCGRTGVADATGASLIGRFNKVARDGPPSRPCRLDAARRVPRVVIPRTTADTWRQCR